MKGYIPRYSEFVEHAHSTLPPRLARRVLRDLRKIAKVFGNPLAVDVEDLALFFEPKTRKHLAKSLRRYKSFVLSQKKEGGDVDERDKTI